MKKGFLSRPPPKRAAPPAVNPREAELARATKEAEDAAAAALERVSLADEQTSKETMAAEKKASDPRKLAEATIDKNNAAAAAKPLSINDLPKEMLVSIFMALGNQTEVRHTISRVCKAWNELYCSKDASPLHEELEVDFKGEAGKIFAEWRERVSHHRVRAAMQSGSDKYIVPAVHASRVIAWAEKRADSVRGLYLDGFYRGCLGPSYARNFSAEDLGRLVQVVGPSLTSIGTGLGLSELLKRPFWEALRDSVVPAGRLRSLVVRGADPSEADVEPLGQLAGSLEDLVLEAPLYASLPLQFRGGAHGLPRFPGFVCSLTELRRLVLQGHPRLTAVPAGILSLKKLEHLVLRSCSLSSLPKQLGELSGLTALKLIGNKNLGTVPEGEAFPAALGKLQSLRDLYLCHCGLRAVPAFVGVLKLLEVLDLSFNGEGICASLDFLIKGCPLLHEVRLLKGPEEGPWSSASLKLVEAFRAKLRAKNPDAKVLHEYYKPDLSGL